MQYTLTYTVIINFLFAGLLCVQSSYVNPNDPLLRLSDVGKAGKAIVDIGGVGDLEVDLASLYDQGRYGGFCELLSQLSTITIPISLDLKQDETTYNQVNRTIYSLDYFDAHIQDTVSLIIKQFIESDKEEVLREVREGRYVERIGSDVHSIYIYFLKTSAFTTDYFLFIRLNESNFLPLSYQPLENRLITLPQDKKFEVFEKVIEKVKLLHDEGKAHNFLRSGSVFINETNNIFITNYEFSSMYGQTRVVDIRTNPIESEDDEFFTAGPSSDLYSIIKIFFKFDQKYYNSSFFQKESSLEELLANMKSCLDLQQGMENKVICKLSSVFMCSVNKNVVRQEISLFEDYIISLIERKDEGFTGYLEFTKKIKQKAIDKNRRLIGMYNSSLLSSSLINRSLLPNQSIIDQNIQNRLII